MSLQYVIQNDSAVFLSYPHGKKCEPTNNNLHICALIGVNLKLAAYRAEASLALCYKLVDAISLCMK